MVHSGNKESSGTAPGLPRATVAGWNETGRLRKQPSDILLTLDSLLGVCPLGLLGSAVIFIMCHA